MEVFGIQSHGFSTCSIRFMRALRSRYAMFASEWLPAFLGWELFTHWVSITCFIFFSLDSSCSVSWRDSRSSCIIRASIAALRRAECTQNEPRRAGTPASTFGDPIDARFAHWTGTSPSMRHPPRLLSVVLLLLSASLFTGCVTSGYKLAPQNTPPAVALNLPSAPPDADTAPAAEAVVNSVIVYKGPGSWKNEAYWDEYVMTVTNRGADLLVVTDASLHVQSGDASKPGENPWVLDRAGKTWWQSNGGRQTGTYLMLGAGSAAGAGIVTAAVMSGGLLVPLSGGAAVAVGVGAAAMVTLPLYAAGTVAMNYKRKHQVQDEFVRRRLVLPLTLAPGQTVQGSLFFRITPSPRELALHCGVGESVNNVVVLLTPLVGLHLRSASPTSGDVASAK